MEKLSLRLDDLQVETFEVAPARGPARGTVRGHLDAAGNDVAINQPAPETKDEANCPLTEWETCCLCPPTEHQANCPPTEWRTCCLCIQTRDIPCVIVV